MKDIVTIGEAMACFIPAAPGPLRHVRQFAKHVVGAEFNLAIGAARLGLATGWISRVGDDEFGREICAILQGEGVDTSQVRTSARPTGIYFREYTPWGEPRVYYYRHGSAASGLGPDDIDPAYVTEARVLHLTGITPLLGEGCRLAVAKAMAIAQEAGVAIAFDPNIRYKLIAREEVPAFYRPFIARSTVLLAGHDELRAIFGGEDLAPEALEQKVLDSGPSLLAIKRGADGAVACTASERVEIEAHPVAQVVDLIGAGDGFDAGFLAAWLRGWDLQRSLRLATLVGACAVGVHGDYEGYPRWPEATAILDHSQIITR
jgi:2-dehydro-3-deoxygluconokinase